MIILGIDPGLNATGYGVINSSTTPMQVLAVGAVCPPPDDTLPQRLLALHDGLARIIRAHHPQVMAIESVFVHYKHLTTAAMMAHARGVACLVGAEHQLPVVEYLPTRAKKAVTGYGYASKDQIARSVGMWLQIDPAGLRADATDALALAIAHAHVSEVPAQTAVLAKARRTRRLAPELAAALAAAGKGAAP